ncbi:MAG: response regulator [Gammaproteobacteria bacterium]|nr:response regulator [Gammaproteobacteria bacterium]
MNRKQNLHPRLLIVEDDCSLRQMLCWELEELGYTVTSVCSCTDAHRSLTSGEYDLALFDYELPDGLGTQLIQQLQSNEKNIPVILYSGCTASDTKAIAIDNGANHFISKPVTATALHQLFQQLLATD